MHRCSLAGDTLHARRLGEASNTRDSSSQQCGPCTAESCQLQEYYDAGKDMAKQVTLLYVQPF